ncbi:Retrovirus-related Pol polyprotein from transposon TNT 1-94 [Linum grandiflorum]
MKIEETNRQKIRAARSKHHSAKAHLVEAEKGSKYKAPAQKKPHWKDRAAPYRKPDTRHNPNYPNGCFVCGKTGHRAHQCNFRKTPGSTSKNQAHLVERNEESRREETRKEESGKEVIAAVIQLESNIIEDRAEWLIDSGACRHFYSSRDLFSTLEESNTGEVVYMGNASSSPIMGKRKINLSLTSGKILALNDVLFLPFLRRNLISARLLIKAGLKLVLDVDKLVITKNGVFVGKGYMSGSLFVMDTIATINKNSAVSSYLIESFDKWHGRLGHVNKNSIRLMRKMNLLTNISGNDLSSKCSICIESKFTKKPFYPVYNRVSSVLDLIHTDLAVFKDIESKGGKRYYITFIDDFSRYTKLYLLRSKDEAEEKFLTYKAEVENQLNKKIKRLRSDRGGEYSSSFLKQVCEQAGIIHETTAPYSPQQNGIAERKNRTLKNMINAMLISSGAPQNLWGEAAHSATHILNRVPHKKLEKTPYELWKGYPPNLNYLRVWGCLAKVGLMDPKRSLLGPKTFDAMFIGYALNSSAYRFLRLDDRSICEYRDAEFMEEKFPFKDTSFKRSREESDLSGDQNSTGETNEFSDITETEIRRSKRQKIPKTFGDDFLTSFLTCVDNFEIVDDLSTNIFLTESEPTTYEEAMNFMEASFWKEAADSEIQSIMAKHTWELVDLPKGCRAIGCKWIFKRKLRPDGSVERYKARLVIKGYSQKSGLDFFDTYSPVTKISTIRVLFALASIFNMTVHQMDVKTAFLNGDLNEEIYMIQPPGCTTPETQNKVCKLKKSLYGLKQAPKQWYEKFNSTISDFGFKPTSSYTCVYTKWFGNSYVILCLYVDDMLIFSSDMSAITETKAFLSSKFEMKDLGPADVILGIKVFKTQNSYTLSQEHYVSKLLKMFLEEGYGSVSTPFDSNFHLKKNLGQTVNQQQYAKIIGSLMFLTNCTRPDVYFAVNRLSRYTSNPSEDHWRGLTRVLRYLKGSADLGLKFTGHPNILEGYCDANWVTSKDDVSSTSGFVFTLGGAAVSWKSTKQTCIARSTMESEFIALDTASQEAEWLRGLLSDLPMWDKPSPSVSMLCDSQAAIHVANSSVFNGKKRHLRIRHESVTVLLESGTISLDYVKSERNLADPLTKGLCKRMVQESTKAMGLWSTS